MILATYLPCKKNNVTNFRCFEIKAPEDLLTKCAGFFADVPMEELVVFETDDAEKDGDFYIVKNVPHQIVKVPLGAIIIGDAFVMDENGRELLPKQQRKKREKSENYIRGKIEESNDSYDNFLLYQKLAFEGFFLPLWAPFVLSKFTNESYPVRMEAELTPSEIDKFCSDYKSKNFDKGKLLHAYYSKGLSPNDVCWCGSGMKMKQCHGR